MKQKYISQLPCIYVGEQYMITQGHVEDGPQGYRYFVIKLEGDGPAKKFFTIDDARKALDLLEHKS